MAMLKRAGVLARPHRRAIVLALREAHASGRLQPASNEAAPAAKRLVLPPNWVEDLAAEEAAQAAAEEKKKLKCPVRAPGEDYSVYNDRMQKYRKQQNALRDVEREAQWEKSDKAEKARWKKDIYSPPRQLTRVLADELKAAGVTSDRESSSSGADVGVGWRVGSRQVQTKGGKPPPPKERGGIHSGRPRSTPTLIPG